MVQSWLPMPSSRSPIVWKLQIKKLFILCQYDGVGFAVLYNFVGKQHIFHFFRSRSFVCHGFQVGYRFNISIFILHQYAIQQSTELFLRQFSFLTNEDDAVLFLSQDFECIHIIIRRDNHFEENLVDFFRSFFVDDTIRNQYTSESRNRVSRQRICPCIQYGRTGSQTTSIVMFQDSESQIFVLVDQINGVIDKAAAEEINKIFFEVIIAPDYDVDALEILGQKKNRIILVRKEAKLPKKQFRALLNGVLVQDKDTNIETVADLRTVTDKAPTPEEVEDMLFANKIVKNSKSNAIVLAKGKQLLASGVGQTSRVDALKQAIEKAKSFGFDLHGAVMASDAFFPFPDCVEIADKEGITAVIQPGGSVKDDLTFAYCNEHGMAMVTTGIRHFKH